MIIEHIDLNPGISVITGMPGSAKTLIALKIAKYLAEEHKSVAFIFNPDDDISIFRNCQSIGFIKIKDWDIRFNELQDLNDNYDVIVVNLDRILWTEFDKYIDFINKGTSIIFTSTTPKMYWFKYEYLPGPRFHSMFRDYLRNVWLCKSEDGPKYSTQVCYPDLMDVISYSIIDLKEDLGYVY